MGQNVFLESGFPDEDATVMALETDVAIAIAHCIRARYPSQQSAAAKHLKIGQNEVSAILSGNIGRFSLEKLLRIARRAGLRMFLDMGDNAHGACATTLAPTIVASAVVVSRAELDVDLTDETVEQRPGTSRNDTRRAVWRH